MKQILIINGSLRTGSFNHQLAQAAEQLLEGKAAVSYLDWEQVPMFSQDLEASTPESVAGVREAIQAADAIWIFHLSIILQSRALSKTYLIGYHAPLICQTHQDHQQSMAS